MLRKNATPWERRLWYEFLRTYPVRFYRQKPLGSFIADFYCAKAKLVLELDGSGHYQPEEKRKDQQRTASLEESGLKVIRISNRKIDQNFRGVCEWINALVLERTGSAPLERGAVSEAD
ncbi:MAG: endonuclease domain-containing protein [Oscillospiraceae bacterium]|nr:endonuclease domain-containing protein [Oscillospiraceae bacterium]